MPPKTPARAAPVQPASGPPLHPFDRDWHTDTGGMVPRERLQTGHSSDQHVTAYYGVAPSILHALVDLWQQQRPALPVDRYTFVDLGAGKGRAVMLASLHPFWSVVGIELNPLLARICQRNLERFTAMAPILSTPRVVQGDVLEVALPRGPLVIFLFNPFEAPLLRRFLERLTAETGSHPVDILYVNAEQLPTLEDNDQFTRVWAGQVPMSPSDYVADLAEVAGQTEYGSTGDEFCVIYRKLSTAPAR